MDVTRRESLGLGAIMVGSGALASPPLTARGTGAGPSLKSLAARSGRQYGSAVAWGRPGQDRGSIANPLYTAILARECNLLVPENELKWQFSRPSSATQYSFRAMDEIVAFARRGGFALRGHTLFWTPEKWYPKWLAEHDFGPYPARAAEALLVNHVQTMCRRYGSAIESFDVVNEAIQPETGAIRDTNVTRALGGEQFLDMMFHTARAEAPRAQLVYNDYMSWERGTEDETHIRGVLKLLEGFRKRGTPVDALGVQSHIRLLKTRPVDEIVRESVGPWRRFLDEVTGMGYELVVTEFDVNDRKAPDDIVVRDRMVADYARAYLDVMMSYPQLSALLAWGMVDRYSWLTDFDPRGDHSIKRGTPYDAKFRAKPLRDAIAMALRGASSHYAPVRKRVA